MSVDNTEMGSWGVNKLSTIAALGVMMMMVMVSVVNAAKYVPKWKKQVTLMHLIGVAQE